MTRDVHTMLCILKDLNTGVEKVVKADDLLDAQKKAERWIRSTSEKPKRTRFVPVSISDVHDTVLACYEIAIHPKPPRCDRLRHKWRLASVVSQDGVEKSIYSCTGCSYLRVMEKDSKMPITKRMGFEIREYIRDQP